MSEQMVRAPRRFIHASRALVRASSPRARRKRSLSRSIFARCDMTLTAHPRRFFPRAERANLRAQGT